jgi:hypothetical protein
LFDLDRNEDFLNVSFWLLEKQKHPRHYLSVAKGYYLLKDFVKSEEYLEKYLKEHVGELADGYVLKSQLLLRERKYEAALDAINNALPVDVTPFNMLMKIELLCRLKRYKEADIEVKAYLIKGYPRVKELIKMEEDIKYYKNLKI